jgi:hypothetical protein
MNMNTEEKLERFSQFLANIISRQEDALLNAPNPILADSYQRSYDLARMIEREFIRTFSTEPKVTIELY